MCEAIKRVIIDEILKKYCSRSHYSSHDTKNYSCEYTDFVYCEPVVTCADENHGSKAFTYVCLRVCLSVRTI